MTETPVASPRVTLGFSTMVGRTEKLFRMLRGLGEIRDVEVVVVIQGGAELIPPSLKFVTLIQDPNLGLSHSRNQVIEHSKGDFIWFLDDDVDIERADIEQLLLRLNSEKNVQVFRARIGCIENKSEFYKSYKSNKILTRLQLLQVSSIELIVERQFINTHHIRFNEQLGLGTPMPATEEVNFVIDINNSRGVIVNLNQTLVYHSCQEDDRILANDGIFQARGMTASRYGFVGMAIIARWACRYFIRYRKLSYVKSLIRGYYQGYGEFTDSLKSDNGRC